MNYFLYARKSTDDEERQVLSIDAQLDELREFAQKESLTVVQEFVESQTAKKPGRPVFNAMMDEVEQDKVDGLIAWHPDRLARNSVDGGRIVYYLDCEHLTSLKFPTFWFDNTPQGKFMLSIAFGQSKYYVDNLSENVRRGMRQKIRRGEFPGKPPIGYLNEPRLRTIIVDEHKAKLVRRMFEAYATGQYTFDQLHELVTSWKLTSHKEKPLARSMLPKYLSNPFYIGMFRYAGELHEGTHEPIISTELFEQVQNVIASRGRPRKTKEKRKAIPFLGFMQCGDCGCAITAERQKGHNYYRCTKKKGDCTQKRYLREESLTEQIRQSIQQVSLSGDVAENMTRQIEEWRNDANHSKATELNR